MSNLLRLDGVELKAVCDIREEACASARRQAAALGKREPTAYTRGERDFERMCEAEDLDLVYTATPWEWHVPVCLAAMRNGKHAATEVPAAITLDDCWQLVETAEQTGKYCVDDGERQLHARGDGDPEDGPRGAPGRAGPRGGRLRARHALPEDQGLRGRALAGGPSSRSGTATSIRCTAWGRWRGT